MRSRKLALLAALALALAAPAAGSHHEEEGSGEMEPESSMEAPAEAEAPMEEAAEAEGEATEEEAAEGEEGSGGSETAPAPDAESSGATDATGESDASSGERAPETSTETVAPEPATAEATTAEDQEAGSAEAAGEETAGASGEESPPAAPAEEPARETAGGETDLGPVGYDDSGTRGRIHVVAPGDTLWDISDAYLGTPWVWPSVWQENQAIDDPHLIYPGDRIWIAAGVMRRVTAEEAERLLANEPPPDEAGEPPASFQEMTDAAGAGGPATYRYSTIQTTGFIGEEELEVAFSIVETPESRRWLGDHDRVVIGRGGGEVEKGDRFDIFRAEEVVRDLETGRRIGRVTRELGWLEVTEVHPESATAVIRLSRDEILVGDRLREYVPPEPEIAIGERPEVAGRIVHLPRNGMSIGEGGVVYLDRGARDGIERGSPLEVYRPLGRATDRVSGEEVGLPDQVVAKLLVVSAREGTATAVVTHSTSEIGRGDRFRGADSIAWKPREPR